VHLRISNSAEYSVLQALQFQEVSVRRILPGGRSVKLMLALASITILGAFKAYAFFVLVT
jgi:hypothetical protein